MNVHKVREPWFAYLKQGLSRRLISDRIAGKEGCSNLRGNLQDLWPLIHRHWRGGILGALFILVISLLSFPPPLITRYLVDQVFLGQKLELLAGAILLWIGISLAERLVGFFQQLHFSRWEKEVVLDIQKDLLDRVLVFPKTFFDRHSTGYLMARLSSDVQEIRWFFSGSAVYAIGNFLRFIGGLAFLFYLEWKLALTTAVVLPGLILMVRFFSKRLHDLAHQNMEQQAGVESHLQESLSSIALIKAFSSEMRTVSHLASALGKGMRFSLEQATVHGVANLLIQSWPGIARVTVLAVGGYWVIQGQWSLGSLLAFQAYLGYVFGPAEFLASANLQLQNARAALERVSALRRILPEENLGQGKRVERLRGEVQFRNVSFSYDGQEPVLENISWHIRPGEHIAIMGPSGVGKTTLLSLILRFYKPTEGEIFFDGEPASALELGSLRRRIGYVSQNTLLLAGTIRENLHYGNPEATDEAIVRAAQAAGIHDFIASLPDGYDAKVEEKGANLSEGQKQRLSIARALVRDPDILIFDEPASGLDIQTEKALFQNLFPRLKGKTIFLVTHRLSSVSAADQVVLLNEKKVISIGSHQSLIQESGYYRALINGQPVGKANGLKFQNHSAGHVQRPVSNC